MFENILGNIKRNVIMSVAYLVATEGTLVPARNLSSAFCSVMVDEKLDLIFVVYTRILYSEARILIFQNRILLFSYFCINFELDCISA